MMTTKTIDDYAQEITSLRYQLHQATEAIEILKSDVAMRDDLIVDLRATLARVNTLTNRWSGQTPSAYPGVVNLRNPS